MEPNTQPGTMPNFNLEPLQDNLIVLPEKAQEELHGIAVSHKALRKPKRGTVVAVGPGRFDEVMTVHVGQKVMFDQYTGIELEHDGTKYLIFKQHQLLCKVKEDE